LSKSDQSTRVRWSFDAGAPRTCNEDGGGLPCVWRGPFNFARVARIVGHRLAVSLLHKH